jgi:hypothetical protein
LLSAGLTTRGPLNGFPDACLNRPARRPSSSTPAD